MFRRIVALALGLTLVLTVIPVKIVNTADALIDDPLDVAIAPHFSRVIYTLTEPDYTTSCDERGDFRALTGTPSITISDSRLFVSPISSTKTSVVLSKVDAPEINQTQAYYEMGFNVSNALSWTNVSLYDLSNDWINISIHSGAFYYDYDSGSRQLGVFYSPAAASTDYTVAFDLTSSSVTLFLYGTNGTLLADKYISNSLLVGGDLDEIRFELQGSSSQAFALDYLYVTAGGTVVSSNIEGLATDPLRPDELKKERMLDLDPTSITLEQGLRRELFGLEEIEDLEPKDAFTTEDVINALGTSEISQQKQSGRLIAEGYKNLQDSVEDSLLAYISDVEDVDTDEIYLIDYYVDYLQCKLEVQHDVVERLAHDFKRVADATFDVLGEDLKYPAKTASALSIPARSLSNTSDDWKMDFLMSNPVIGLFIKGLATAKGLLDDPFGLKKLTEQVLALLEDIFGDMATWADRTYNQTLAVLLDWQKSTDEAFRQVRQDYFSFISVVQAQTSQLASAYEDMQDRFERTITKYFSWTQNQFEASNAIISKLLLQNEDLAANAQAMNEYFAGELTKTNEVVLNITSALVQALSAQDFWKNVMDGGKPASEPLTFSAVFGNNLMEIITIIVIAFMIAMLALVLIIVFRRPRRAKAVRY